MGKCPVCGSSGDDLLFKFYCSDLTCQNADPHLVEDNLKVINSSLEEEIKDLLHFMWQVYGENEESSERFTEKFYNVGGSITFDGKDIYFTSLKIVEPEWLLERMRSK